MCSFYISGGDEIELKLTLDGHVQRELTGSACSDTRQDTYSTNLYVGHNIAPGDDSRPVYGCVRSSHVQCMVLPGTN